VGIPLLQAERLPTLAPASSSLPAIVVLTVSRFFSPTLAGFSPALLAAPSADGLSGNLHFPFLSLSKGDLLSPVPALRLIRHFPFFWRGISCSPLGFLEVFFLVRQPPRPAPGQVPRGFSAVLVTPFRYSPPGPSSLLLMWSLFYFAG